MKFRDRDTDPVTAYTRVIGDGFPDLSRHLHWMDRAACAEHGPDDTTWFPAKGGSAKDARAICKGCEVATECFTHSLETNERWGIWAGVTERQRKKLLRDRRRAA